MDSAISNCKSFVANEYVAACWSVSCHVPYESDKGYDPIVKNDINNLHRKEFCGAPDAFKIETDSAGNPKELIEIKVGSTNGKKPLGTVIYSDPEFKIQKNISDVKVGETIYFTTKNGRTWYHHGEVKATNHS